MIGSEDMIKLVAGLIHSPLHIVVLAPAHSVFTKLLILLFLQYILFYLSSLLDEEKLMS